MFKKVYINYKKKRIKVIANNCNFFKKISGLMFSRRKNAEILLFDFKQKQKIIIHSFFVFYPFLAIWLDKKNKVIESRIVNPFNPYVSSEKPVFKLIEIPINKKNRRILSLFSS